MKRVFPVIVIIIFVFLIVSFFIPVSREQRLFISNTYQNLASSLDQPRNWIKWNSDVRDAWQKDSLTCHFQRDSAQNILTIEIPGKKIRITGLSYLLYQLEEVKNNRTSSAFGFGIVPYVGNGQQQSQHNSEIAYSYQTNLFYKLFPFMEKEPFANRTIAGLRSYLENNTRFYGFPIDIKPAADTFFLTRNQDLTRQEVFSRLPLLFHDLDTFARANGCQPGKKNISYTMQGHDSLTLMAGINIDKMIKGDYLFNFRQLAGDQMLAVGTFKGLYRDRPLLYQAMEKYLIDHQLMRMALPYERYSSALPIADSSTVSFELCYPLRSH
jgi:hypothetical protein